MSQIPETNPGNPPDTPVLDRIRKIGQQGQAVGEFIEWLALEGYWIAAPSNMKYEGHQDCLEPAIVSRNGLINRFFGIDQQQETAEREAMLEYVRNIQTADPTA